MTIYEERIYKIITTAISKQKMITLTYTTQAGNKVAKKKVVTVEPYLVGEHKNSLNIMLSAFYLPTKEQVSAGEKEDWRLYLLKNITDVALLDIPFSGDREQYNSKPEMMNKVLTCIPK